MLHINATVYSLQLVKMVVYKNMDINGQKRNWNDDVDKLLHDIIISYRITWDRIEWERLRKAFVQNQGRAG
mgnify:CR=1 FL=1